MYYHLILRIADLWTSILSRVLSQSASDSEHESKRKQLTGHDVVPQKESCPYEYLLNVYGRDHFQHIVNVLDPALQARDRKLYSMILEIMDAIHFGAILVDDVADKSKLRKGKPTAHTIFGSSETINRAYLRILEVIGKFQRVRPSLVPFIIEGLMQIHKGEMHCGPPFPLFELH